MSGLVPLRWCWQRLKRIILVLGFITVIAILASTAFVVLNSEHTFQLARRAVASSKQNSEDAKRGKNVTASICFYC